MSTKEKIKIRFETSAIYYLPGCDIAYGRLYLNDMSMPSLRLCIGTFMHDLPLRVDGDRLIIVEKAPYFVQIPPYRYVTYMTAPNMLYLISAWGAKRLFCNLSVETCNKLPASVEGPTHIEYVYAALKSALVSGET